MLKLKLDTFAMVSVLGKGCMKCGARQAWQVEMVSYRDEFHRVGDVRETEVAMRQLCEGKMRFVKMYMQ